MSRRVNLHSMRRIGRLIYRSQDGRGMLRGEIGGLEVCIIRDEATDDRRAYNVLSAHADDVIAHLERLAEAPERPSRLKARRVRSRRRHDGKRAAREVLAKLSSSDLDDGLDDLWREPSLAKEGG